MIPSFSTNFSSRKLIYALDMPSFQRDFASLKTLDHGTGPAITFTRASQATFFDADGVLQTASNNTPRFDHDPATGASRGLLIEEARTNSIRNSQAGGAVVGAPGTMPTNWTTVLATGISREVVAAGTVNGMNYVDLRISGTRSGGAIGSLSIFFETTTQVVAATGQTWTGSMYVATIAGNFTNITTPQLVISERSDAGSQLVTSTTAYTPSATMTRISVTRTFTNASTERTSTQFVGQIADGATIDVTLRIAALQLEQGAFATSYIPTTNAAATRAADSAVVTPISSFYNQAEGTVLTEALRTISVASGVFPTAIRFQASNPLFRSGITVTNNRAYWAGTNNTTPEWEIGSTLSKYNITVGTPFRFAGCYATNNIAASMNGQTVDTDTVANVIEGVATLRIGQANNASYFNGYIRKIAYWPKRLTNTLLEQLTT